MKRNIINTYKRLVLKIYNQGSVSISNKILDIFIEKYSKILTEDFVWDYITFQLEYWSKLSTNHSLKPSWVFGFKAIERWEKRGPNWKYFVQQFLNRNEVERPITFFSSNLSSHFEQIRGNNFNTEEGFLECIADALYSKDSKYCKVCDFEDICKKI